MLLIEVVIYKMLVRIVIVLQKQSDLGLDCLSRPLWPATSVRNFRAFTMVGPVHNILVIIAYRECL